MFAPKHKSGADLNEMRRLKDKHESHSKRHGECLKGNSNTDWWRRAPFQALYSSTTERRAVRTEPVIEVDRPF